MEPNCKTRSFLLSLNLVIAIINSGIIHWNEQAKHFTVSTILILCLKKRIKIPRFSTQQVYGLSDQSEQNRTLNSAVVYK